MGIQTSQVTTQTDGDLSINPNGTGKVVLPKLSGSGEVPVSVDTDGNVKPLDERQLTELTAIDPADLMMVQRGDDYYSFDVNQLSSGGSFANPAPGDIVWSPTTPPGSGTQADPFILTPATCFSVGGSISSVESAVVINQKPDSILLFTEIGGTSGFRFDQPSQEMNNAGQSNAFKFVYNDTPNTVSGQTYNGIIRMGPSGTYVKWDVTQIANLTQFSPAGAPNASPGSVNYVFDNKYGKVSGVYADGAGVLTATNAARFTLGTSAPVTLGTVNVGDTLGILFDEATVDAAAQGDEISGTISTADGFLLSPSFTINRNADPFTIPPSTNAGASSVISSSNISITGINCKSYVTLGTSTLTSVEASVNGAAFAAIPASGTTMPINPGDTLIVRGTTGATASTAYLAQIKVGTTAASWSVTTSSTSPSISQPVIISPVNGAADIVPDIEVVGSAYGALNGAGPHTSSDWEVYQADVTALSTSTITGFTTGPLPWQTVSVSANTGFGSVSYIAKYDTWLATYPKWPSSGYARSTDGGKTWVYRDVGNMALEDSAVGNDGRVLMANSWANSIGTNGPYMYSDDGGVNWTYAYTGLFLEENFNYVAVATNGLGQWIMMKDIPYTAWPGCVSNNNGVGGDYSWGAMQAMPGSAGNGWGGLRPGGLAYGNGRYVAANYMGGNSNTGTSNQFYYSTNGYSWTGVGSYTLGVAWTGVAYGNGVWVAVSEGGNVAYSTNNATSWSNGTIPNYRWSDVTFDGTRFVAVASKKAQVQGSLGTVAYSTDGITWTEDDPQLSGEWRAVGYGDGVTIAVGNSPGTVHAPAAMRSESAAEALQLADNSNLTQFSPGMAIEQNKGGTPETSAITNVVSENDGWTLTSAANFAWTQGAYGGGTYAVIGDAVTGFGGSDTKAAYSTDGVTWLTGTITFPGGPPNAQYQSLSNEVVYGATSGTFLSLGGGGQGGNIDFGGRVMRSTNGINWTMINQTGATDIARFSKVWNSAAQDESGRWAAVAGDLGFADDATNVKAYYSDDDGVTWAKATMGNTTNNPVWRSVAYAQGKFLAVGTGGGNNLMQSTDGSSWTAGAALPSASAYAIVYGSAVSKWVIATADGLYYSTNGTSGYVACTTDVPGVGCYELKYHDGTFLANINNKVYYSTDGITFDTSASSQLPTTSAWTFAGGSEWLAIGSTDKAIYRSPNGTGSSYSVLNLTNDTNLANFLPGDVVQTNPDEVKVIIVDVDNSEMTVDGGTWSNGDTVTGPTFTPATGTVGSVDATAKTITLSSSDQTGTKRWLITEAGYDSAKKLNAGVTSPSFPQNVTPGAPQTDPPSASIYTKVVDSAADTTNLVEYPLTDAELDPNKAYYSRVRYNDNGSVVSPFSEYGVFITNKTFLPEATTWRYAETELALRWLDGAYNPNTGTTILVAITGYVGRSVNDDPSSWTVTSVTDTTGGAYLQSVAWAPVDGTTSGRWALLRLDGVTLKSDDDGVTWQSGTTIPDPSGLPTGATSVGYAFIRWHQQVEKFIVGGRTETGATSNWTVNGTIDVTGWSSSPVVVALGWRASSSYIANTRYFEWAGNIIQPNFGSYGGFYSISSESPTQIAFGDGAQYCVDGNAEAGMLALSYKQRNVYAYPNWASESLSGGGIISQYPVSLPKANSQKLIAERDGMFIIAVSGARETCYSQDGGLTWIQGGSIPSPVPASFTAMKSLGKATFLLAGGSSSKFIPYTKD